MAQQTCLFRTANKDSAKRFIEYVKEKGMEVSYNSLKTGKFFCSLIDVTDNDYNVNRHADIRAYADSLWVELLEINGVPIEHEQE